MAKQHHFLQRFFSFSVGAFFLGACFSVSLLGVASVLVLAAALWAASEPEFRRSLRDQPLAWPTVALVGAIAVSLVLSESTNWMKPLGKVRYLAAAPLLGAWLWQRGSLPRWFWPVARIATGVLAVVALLQFVGVGEHLTWIERHQYPFHPGSQLHRVSGFHFNPIPFAATAAMLSFLFLGRCLAAGAEKSAPEKKRDLLFAVLGFAPLVGSGSRAAWLGAAAALVFLSLRTKDSRWTWRLVGVFAVLVVLVFAIPAFRDRLLVYQSSSDPIRLTLWGAGWRMFLDAPIFGHGYFRFPELVSRYAPPGGLDARAWEVHSTYLELLAGTGVVGFVSFVWWVAAAFRSLLHAPTNESFERAGLRWAGLGYLVFFVFAAGFDVLLYTSVSLGATVFLLGIATAVPRVSAAKSLARSSKGTST